MSEQRGKKLQVFVSSTYKDLIHERQAAVQAILAAGHIPAGMELFAAGDESQMEVIERWIDQSDVYLLILGGRYGSKEPKTGKSYTQIEYEYALKAGMPCFACVLHDDIFGMREQGIDHRVEFLEFRRLVLSKVCGFWEDSKDIKCIIMQKLAELTPRMDLGGWIRATPVARSSEAAEDRVLSVRDFLDSFQELEPLLFKLDVPIEGVDAKFYLEKMQEFFCGWCLFNEVFSDTLVFATDLLLRVITATPDDEHYRYGKLSGAQMQWNLYTKAYSAFEISEISRDERLKQQFHLLHSQLGDLCEVIKEEKPQDVLLLRLTMALIDYARAAEKEPYPFISHAIHGALREVLNYGLTLHFNIKLPDSIDESAVDEMKLYCSRSWDEREL